MIGKYLDKCLSDWSRIYGQSTQTEMRLKSHLVYCHQFLRSVNLVFVEGDKFDVSRWSCLVSERWFDRIQIVCTNGD